MAIKPNTKQLLAASFEKLLQRFPYEDITVKQIVENCGASRAVFYRYFKDKQDLMQWFFRSQMEEGFEEYKEDPRLWSEDTLRVMRIMYDHRQIAKKLINDKENHSFVDLLYDLGQWHTTGMTKLRLQTDALSPEIIASINMWVGGVTYVMIDWVRRDCPESPEDITAAIHENLPPRLQFIFQTSSK